MINAWAAFVCACGALSQGQGDAFPRAL